MHIPDITADHIAVQIRKASERIKEAETELHAAREQENQLIDAIDQFNDAKRRLFAYFAQEEHPTEPPGVHPEG